jgi:hypothetical protein
MAITAELHDGRTLSFPDGTDPVVVQATVKKMLAPAPSTPDQELRASFLGRVAQGIADPAIGTAQLIGKGVDMIAPSLEVGKNITDYYGSAEKNYEAARKATGQEGFDGGRALGTMIGAAPLAAVLPAAGATTMARIGAGAVSGAIGGATQFTDSPDYWKSKAAQVGVGGATGGAFGPLMGKIGDTLVRKFGTKAVDPATLKNDVFEAVGKAFAEIGADRATIHPDQIANITAMAEDALKNGKQLDLAALARKADFDQLEMPSLLGQITRDPNQFAKEKNIRSLAGAEPIMTSMTGQNQSLSSHVSNLAGHATDQLTASEKLAQALLAHDNKLRSGVSEAYKAAWESSGKDLDIPLQGLAQDFAKISADFGDKIPSGVRNNFEKLGLLDGKQKSVFSIESAEKLLQNINDNMVNDPKGMLASKKLNEAVKRAILEADDQGGVYKPARELAAQRFALHDQVPAIEAAFQGKLPDDFIQKFVINGKPTQVKALAELLKAEAPEAFDSARGQIGAEMERAAFGENVTGDKLFTPERYAKALRTMGPKIEAFFSPEEVSKMGNISRVGSYVNQTPGVSAVNTSNTAAANASNKLGIYGGAVLDAAKAIPLVSAPLRAAGGAMSAVKNAVGNQMAIADALRSEIPSKVREFTPEQLKAISQFLAGAAGGAGMAAGSSVVQ